jgi:hypothetical protein
MSSAGACTLRGVKAACFPDELPAARMEVEMRVTGERETA